MRRVKYILLEKARRRDLTLRNVQKHANVREIQFIDAQKGARGVSLVSEYEEFYGVCPDCGDREVKSGFRV